MKTLADAVHYLEQGAWEKAHAIVQEDETRLGYWLHGIVHRLEGDLGNARYWYARANRAFETTRTAEDEIAAAKQQLKRQDASAKR